MHFLYRYSPSGCFCFICFFLFDSMHCLAQPNGINLLPNDYFLSIKTDSVSIKNRQLQIQSIEGNMPDSAIVQYWQTYRESLRIGYNSGIATALRKLGKLYYSKDLYDSARICLEESLAYIKLSGEIEELFGPLVCLGNIHGQHAHYELALDRYYEAIDVIHKFTTKVPPSYPFNTYCNIALVWTRLGSNQRAKDVLQILDKIASDSRDSILLLMYNCMAAGILQPGDTKKALSYYKKALSYQNPKVPAGHIFPLYNNLAHTYMELGDLDSARYFVNEAFKLEQKHPEGYNLQIQTMHSWDNLAHIYHKQGKYKDAAQIWNFVAKEVQGKGMVDLFMHIAPHIADNYNIMGQPQKAYNILLLYHKLHDSITNFQKSRSTELWLQSYLEKKNKIVLEHELRLNKQETLIKTKNFWIAGSILSALLLVVVMIAIIRSYQNKQKLQAASMTRLEQEQEINQLKAQVRGEEQERNRIAIELHDGIASELWSIKLNVGCMRDLERTGRIEEGRWEPIFYQLHQAVQRVRTTAHNLRPDLLLEEGLGPALSTLCHRMKGQTGLHIEFQEYGPIIRINEEIELTVYRMIQELMQNALKHAIGANHLLVQLSCTDHLLNITVEDNGAGFPEEDLFQFSGFGLGNIKKRVTSLHGHFELKSQPGEGTTAYLEFDLRQLL